MKSITVICPTCSRALTVSNEAPPKLTCPACLASVDNPEEFAAKVAIPVIPMERQMHSDGRTATVLVIVLLPLLLLGIWAAVLSPELRSSIQVLGLIVVIFGIIAYVLVVAQTGHTHRRAAHLSHAGLDQEETPDDAKPTPGPILHPGVQFTVGFVVVVALAASVIAFAHYRALVLIDATLILLSFGLIAVCLSRIRSIGLGILLGLGFCIVLPFGLCFVFLGSVFLK